MSTQTGIYRDAAEMWDRFRLPTNRSLRERKWIREAFLRRHPNGHRDSIKSELESLADIRLSGKEIPYPFHHLNQIHPQAWPLLLEHGKDYRPKMVRGSGMRDSPGQPLPRRCYANSARLMMKLNKETGGNETTYVEGCIQGPTVWVQLHAWNGYRFSHHAADWTFYPVTHWCRYFGVPFSEEEYREILQIGKAPRPMGLLFSEEDFPMYEPEIREVLKRPRTRLIVPKN